MTCPACIEKPEIFLSTSCQRLKKFPEQLQPIYENEFLGIYTVQVEYPFAFFSILTYNFRCLTASYLEKQST